MRADYLAYTLLDTVVDHYFYVLEKFGERIEEIEDEPETAPVAEDKIENYLTLDPMEIDIGYGLIPMVDTGEGGNLLDKITTLRKQCALEIGIIVPPIRIRDNLQLNLNEYVFKIRGNEIIRNEVMTGCYLALNPGTASREIEGIQTIEPAFGLPAVWIPEAKKEDTELAGYTIIEPSAVMTTHLKEVIRQNAHLLLTRQDVQNLIDNVKKEHKTVIEELIPGQMTIGSVQKVLQKLLKENVPIRDMVTILEVLSDYIPMTKDLDILTEYVRKALAWSIFQQYQTDSDTFSAITLDPRIEEMIVEAFTKAQTQGGEMALSPEMMGKIYEDLSSKVEAIQANGETPIVVCSPMVRPYFYKLIESALSGVVVLSYAEIPADVQIRAIATIGL